ncbi:MAG: adenosine kinase [Lentisphaeria bacterium]|nr:adenosine kinase [Lentisphaeria bacterium]
MSFGVIGAGSPLVDYTAAVSDCFLQQHLDGCKGGTVHISNSEREVLLRKLGSTMLRTPGGAAANTIAALGKLHVRTAFIGKLGDDDDGDFFRRSMISSGVSPEYLYTVPGRETGYCLSLVTPDAERTMRSNLGVSTAWTPAEFSPQMFTDHSWLLSEGYMLQIPGFDRIFDAAHAAGCQTALDLSSIEIARAMRDELPSLIENKIDLLLCNADEAAALTGIPSPEENISLLVKLTGTVVIKMGEHGSLIASKTSNIIRVPAIAEAPVIDTTAAGDHYAAGFFFGLSQNAGLELCGQYGAYLGGAIATVSGSRLPEEYWQKFFKKFDL